MPPAELIRELLAVLPPRSVLSDAADLTPYESDMFSAAKVRPAAVVLPASAEQVAAVVKVLARHGAPIVPRGAGTGLTGGSVAFENGVVISTVRMNRILKIDLENRVAHVEAGVRNLQLSDAVRQLPGGADYHFAPDPSSQRTSTIGGNAATNAAGVRTLVDFAASNHVLGMEIVLPDGQLVELGGRNGACDGGGLDLTGLICGSEGTLGIITRLWVRLSPRPHAGRTLLGLFPTVDGALESAGDIVTAGILPAAMEILDGPFLRAIERAFHLGLPAEAEAMLLVELEGIEQLLDGQGEQIADLCRAHGAFSVESASDVAGRARLGRARKSAFGALGRIGGKYCTQDACVPRSALGTVLKRINEIAAEHGVTVHHLVHVADGNLHPIFLFDDADADKVRRTLAAIDESMRYCIEVGGTFAGEHGVGLEKLHLLPWMFDGPTLEQFRRVKASFDPEDRINAGKRLADRDAASIPFKPGRHVPQ